MIREDTVFGPIFSRRLGSSLGINLLPRQGKICNFDCIYCECGWNKDGHDDHQLPTREQVRIALDTKLQEIVAQGTQVDSITFSGDGEPTLHPDFVGIIDDTLELRDNYLPNTKVSVLSNATRVHIPEIAAALRKVDRPILKIDAPSDELAALINRPSPDYKIERTIEALKRFDGEFILQTMFLRCKYFDSSAPEVLLPWMEIVRTLRPRQIMIYTIARPTPETGLEKFTAKQMSKLVQPLLDEGFSIQINE